MKKEDYIEEIKYLRKEIIEVTKFTCEYWWPKFEASQNTSMDTPTLSVVIWDIIEQRGRYVLKLEERLRKIISLIKL